MPKAELKRLPREAISAVAMRFRALGEVSRLSIIQSLQGGEKNVSELVQETKLSQPNVSRHLAVLVNAGLVGRRKDGLNVLYRVVDEHLNDICAIVCKSVVERKPPRNKKLSAR